MNAVEALPMAQDDEGNWIVESRCRSCQVVVKLKTEADNRPNLIARRFAQFVICDVCLAAEEAAAERAQTAAARKRRLDDSQLPPALHGFVFEDMEIGGRRDAAIDAALKWGTDTKPRGVCLFGEAGVGKTRLAATATWLRLGHSPVRWVNVAILLAKVSASFGSDDRRQAVEAITGTGTLVLDDLDKINPTDWALSQLYAAIDSRVAAGSPLFVTTNKSPSQLVGMFGKPIVSRIVGSCDVFEMDGRDRRIVLDYTNEGNANG